MKSKKIVILTISAIATILMLVAIIVGVINKNDDDLSKDNPTNKNGIELIIGNDTITDYYINDEFIYPRVCVKYSDERVVDVTNSERLTVKGFDLSKSGVQTIEIKYYEGSLSAKYEYKIYIYPATVTSITATYSESEIFWGNKIDKEKLTVIAKYSNSTEKQIFDYKLKYNSEPENYGPNNVTVTYKDFSFSFTLNVIEKEVDEEYSSIEDEAKIILTKLGKINPTCPKDYSFIKNAYGKGYISSKGFFEGYTEDLANELYMFLGLDVFNGYNLTEGPDESIEAIFPSMKLVFNNETSRICATIYVLNRSEYLEYILHISFME